MKLWWESFVIVWNQPAELTRGDGIMLWGFVSWLMIDMAIRHG